MTTNHLSLQVSQRTHKCPTGNAQQTNIMDQTTIKDQMSVNFPDIRDDMCKTQKENQLMLDIVHNEENKYVLVINTQGQQLLTKECNIEKIKAINKKQKLKECAVTNNENENTGGMWKSDIPNGSMFKKPIESYKAIQSKNEKPFQEDTNDFFSMVMSPLENGSPTSEMEHLRVSSPIQKEDISKSFDTFKNTTHGMEMNIFNADMVQSYSDNNANNLQTINEESLKQLLYSIDEK